MAMPIPIAKGERGLLRLFSVGLSEPELRLMAGPSAPPETGPARPYAPAAARLLGLPGLDTGKAELFPLSDLADMGLARYLHDAYDIPPEQLAAHSDDLAALDGFVLLLPSGALPPETRASGETLTPDPALRFLTTFETPRAAVSMARLASPAGQGGDISPPAAPRPARPAFLTRLLVLGLALALAALFILALRPLFR